MTAELEIESDHVTITISADPAGADVCLTDNLIDDGDGDYSGMFVSCGADQMRQLRRFLEYCYPASEDPPHDLDPWVRTSRVRWDPPPPTATPRRDHTASLG